MNIRDPKDSNFYPWEKGGKGMTREEAKQSSSIEEIWVVADFIVDADLAVSSYLDKKPIITEGREVRQGEGPSHSC